VEAETGQEAAEIVSSQAGTPTDWEVKGTMDDYIEEVRKLDAMTEVYVR
jgi:hypothetical protein